LLSLLENLDKKAETTTLSEQEIHLKHFLKESLVLLLREEELKWYERAKVKTLLEGDDNTRFFHLVANGKHRKQHIFKLENDQGVVIGDEHLKSHITRFYNKLQHISFLMKTVGRYRLSF
jgi:mannosylglycoprotein endo-beta-mannosidase